MSQNLDTNKVTKCHSTFRILSVPKDTEQILKKKSCIQLCCLYRKRPMVNSCIQWFSLYKSVAVVNACILVMVRIVIFNICECEFQCEYYTLIFANANANIFFILMLITL